MKGGEIISRNDFAISIAGFMLVFAGQSLLAATWSTYGVFEQVNVIFDTDPSTRKLAFAHAKSLKVFNHPFLSYYFSVPIRVIQVSGSLLGLVVSEENFREMLALYVAPLCSALKTACLYFSFRLLGLKAIDACLISALGSLSFSSVVFGATPTSYAVTGFALALVTLLTLVFYIHPSRRNQVALIFAGLVSIGTTVTNVIHFGWMYWTTITSQRLYTVRGLVKSTLLSALMLSSAVVVSYGLSEVRGENPEPTDLVVSGEWIKKFQPNLGDKIEGLARFPETVGRTFIPTLPERANNRLAILRDKSIQFELSYENVRFGSVSFLLSIVALVAVGGGALRSYNLNGNWRKIGIASTLSIVTFGVFYSWFGLNTYLYSQVWQVPSLLLIGSWLKNPPLDSRIVRSGFSLVLLCFLLGDIYIIKIINQWLLNLS